jgi:hypothetical protein
MPAGHRRRGISLSFREQKLYMQSRKDDALEKLQGDIEKMGDEKLDVTIAEYIEVAGKQVEYAQLRWELQNEIRIHFLQGMRELH